MCGRIPRVAIDAAWPDVALDRVAELLRAVRCPLLGPDQPNVPLAFTRGGEAVTVQWHCGRLVARPITPALFAIDIVGHVCRPVKLARGWYERAIRAGAKIRLIDGLSVAEDAVPYGTPCGFPASFARAFLASHRVDWLPMLYSHHLAAWRPDAVLLPEWNVFRDRIVEVPVSTEVAASVPTAVAPIPTEMAALVSTEMAAPVSTEMAAPVSTEMAVPALTEVAAPASTAVAAPVSTKMASRSRPRWRCRSRPRWRRILRTRCN